MSRDMVKLNISHLNRQAGKNFLSAFRGEEEKNTKKRHLVRKEVQEQTKIRLKSFRKKRFAMQFKVFSFDFTNKN